MIIRPSTDGSKFIYLLNAMEVAAQADDPSRLGYAEKRRAVLDYVANLERSDGPKWIPVSERLPAADESVLICIGKREQVSVGYCDKLAGSHTWVDSTEWVSEEGWPSDADVTHWMPLPDAPNAAQENK